MPPNSRPWWALLFRAPCWNWPKRGPWWARARRWLLHVVWRHEAESCDRGGGRVRTAWICRRDMWRPAYLSATGTDRGEAGVLCERCFALAYRDAAGQNVIWIAPYEDDSDYQAWLASCAADCQCCPRCAPESPCGGVLQGGFCDRFTCTCDDDPDEWDGPDYSEEDFDAQ